MTAASEMLTEAVVRMHHRGCHRFACRRRGCTQISLLSTAGSTACSPCRCRGRPLPPGALSTDMRRLASAVSWLHCCAAALSRPPGKPPAQAYTCQASGQGICPEELAACKRANSCMTAPHVDGIDDVGSKLQWSAAHLGRGSGGLHAAPRRLRRSCCAEPHPENCAAQCRAPPVVQAASTSAYDTQFAATLLPSFQPGRLAHR